MLLYACCFYVCGNFDSNSYSLQACGVHHAWTLVVRRRWGTSLATVTRCVKLTEGLLAGFPTALSSCLGHAVEGLSRSYPTVCGHQGNGSTLWDIWCPISVRPQPLFAQHVTSHVPWLSCFFSTVRGLLEGNQICGTFAKSRGLHLSGRGTLQYLPRFLAPSPTSEASSR